MATQVGACVANEAKTGEILVSRTVKDLVAGSGVEFEDRGVHSLPGVGEWRLFEVQRSAKKKYLRGPSTDSADYTEFFLEQLSR